LDSRTRLEPEHGAGNPLHDSMILFHDMIQILPLKVASGWGLSFKTQRLMIAWSTDTPRSYMSSSTWR
jgi:hypothetical protein